ncbi:two-component regulator propeller domain-containing protein [Lutibacter sp. TH_r2]|uniref:hybrid sensor histidine kinase/response regulator transcription factor n=1 Tax=Lutibacter sp. TH_r2 TaxID=3082083 RepID=UPI002954EB82|nr:two-component regulator propeller domain-containing protein [Lutibacter sp. TH_r2]MDV7185962.1 two-component regulator propeller domain-containing protein [Lutibacter sp. TH_r2]
MINKYFNNIYIILVLLLSCFIENSLAQNTIEFEHLSTADGLSQSDVNTIYQDKQGFMWFGTHDGLNRYDGYKFTVFVPDSNDSTSINSNLIFAIDGDEKDNLWVGTTGKGLNYFDRTTEKFTHYVHDKNNDNSISSNYINTLYVDSKDRLWVGTDLGIDMVERDKTTNEVKINHYDFSVPVNPLFGNININCFYEDSNHQIWVAGIQGLFKLSRDENGDFYFQYLSEIFGITQMQVRSIILDSLGRMIIGSSNGLYVLDWKNENIKLEKITYGSFNKLKISNNELWAGGVNGLYHYSINTTTNKYKLIKHYKYDPKNPSGTLSRSSVKSLFIDKTGIVWVGSNASGVNKLDLHQKKFQHIKKTLSPTSLTNSSIKTIFEDSNGALWIGTEEGGLNYVHKKDKNKEYTNFNSLLNNRTPIKIFEIEEFGIKKLLVGTTNFPGLYVIDITKPNQNYVAELNKEIPNSVFSILQDKNKNLWIGTYSGGLYRWLKSEGSSGYKKDVLYNNINDSTSIPNNIIRDIYQDKKGNIWFATANGLSMLTEEESIVKSPKFLTFKNEKNNPLSLSHNYILTIFESSVGDLWLGTLGGGLNKIIYSEKGEITSFKTYSKNNGLPNNVIKGILEDKLGNLWISSNGGLSKFNPTSEEFKNYDINDGLQNNEFGELACLKRENGEMLFGGVNGFNIFNPENIKENSSKAQTVLTGFSIFNKLVKIGEKVNGRVILQKSINQIEEIELKYSENSFSFEFAALHYAASRKNNYAYKLEGFNEDWMYTNSDNRYATYTNLEPGDYVLKVKASNNDGAWDETPYELKINVKPPYWRTNYAKVIYALLFLASLLAFRRFTIIKTTKKHQLELEHLEKEKHEEINKLKLEFFTNISHEFRTPLTLIKGPLEFLQKKGESLSADKIKEQYNLMQKNTEYLLRLVNQLLDFRKMDKGKMDLKVGESNLAYFIEEVGEPFQFLARNKNIDFKIKSENKKMLAWFDPDAVEKIMNNLLSNAFKFTPKNGEITVSLNNGLDFKVPEGMKTKTDKSNYVIISVKDSGPGIPKHRINFIFERFYVDRDVRKINTEGSGIGLAFIKKLVELHQGSIDVSSNPKDGTQFLVWLPIHKESYENINGIYFSDPEESKTFINQKNAESHAIEVIDDIVDQNISKTRSKLPVVLIVDDNSDIRAFIKQGLIDKYDVYEAENGQRGCELAKKLLPNIILTDILMPVMDGIEFCNKLKSTQETSHIPVVMLTAKISQEWEIEGLRTGADAYIRKPFDMELLELKLENILKHREELRRRFNREITLQPHEVTVTSADEKFLQKAIDIVEKHMMNTEFSVELLVKEMALSRSNLYLKIKELTGLSSSEFIRNIRLKRAMQLLEKSDLSVKEIMYMTGFNTASYFSKCFKKQFGVIPSKYVREVKNSENKDSEEN